MEAELASFSQASVDADRAQIRQIWPQLTSVSRRFADLDAMGVDVQVIGPMPMHRYWAEPQLAAKLTTVTNEAVAAHCASGGGRLVGLGALPLQHPDLAVRALSRAMGELGLRGVSVSTNVAGRELADRAFDPVWEAAADLGAVVFIHPWGCSLGSRLGANFLGNTFGQPTETALALSHLIFGGTLHRHPSLKLLSAHGGGFLPTYISRSDHAWEHRPDARGCGGNHQPAGRELPDDCRDRRDANACRATVDAASNRPVHRGARARGLRRHPRDDGARRPQRLELRRRVRADGSGGAVIDKAECTAAFDTFIAWSGTK